MEIALHWVIIIGICMTSLLSVFFSIKARRQSDSRLRGLNTARLNMSMGVMLVFIALFFMLAYTGSTIKVIIGTLLLIMGLFNLFAGLRNHSVYNAMKR
ncbi:hypothetical protein PAECIP111893_04548 [Paenibacillus plantiphilus]|uniref:YtpI-like protein n=1 Tax=Paenibacillus plantiphilus TaxID=2905650 RepID=A0ABM9CNC6_9BACL|nr:YtpI family protein [Paenibacillus plantiphilus]CAH1219349.1 hypothetical protein PAECIP111893_04548 [Paenibacillus plantiphilus]